MKMFKRVLAAGAALMMAVTGMAMNASATVTEKSWMVRRVIINSYISSESVSSCTNTLAPTLNHPVTKVVSACTSYSSGQLSSGNKLGVHYWLSRKTHAGVLIEYKGYKHYTSTDAKSVDLYPNYIYKSDVAYAEYTIDYSYLLNCYINGETYFTTQN